MSSGLPSRLHIGLSVHTSRHLVINILASVSVKESGHVSKCNVTGNFSLERTSKNGPV